MGKEDIEREARKGGRNSPVGLSSAESLLARIAASPKEGTLIYKPEGWKVGESLARASEGMSDILAQLPEDCKFLLRISETQGMYAERWEDTVYVDASHDTTEIKQMKDIHFMVSTGYPEATTHGLFCLQLYGRNRDNVLGYI